MKVLLTILLLTSACLAQTPVADPPELATLKTRHQAEVHSAAVPIQTRYVAGLKSLLAAASRSGNLESGFAVQQELDVMNGKAPKDLGGKPSPELTALRDRYETEVKAATAKLMPKYIAALEQLQNRLTKTGNLNAAAAVRNELTAARSQPTAPPPSLSPPLRETLTKREGAVETLIGVWNFAYLNGFKNKKTFFRDYTFESNNKPGKWEIKGNKVLLTHSDGPVHTMFFPIDPNGTKGENHNGDRFVATRE